MKRSDKFKTVIDATEKLQQTIYDLLGDEWCEPFPALLHALNDECAQALDEERFAEEEKYGIDMPERNPKLPKV